MVMLRLLRIVGFAFYKGKELYRLSKRLNVSWGYFIFKAVPQSDVALSGATEDE
jgi:hypothetical protein